MTGARQLPPFPNPRAVPTLRVEVAGGYLGLGRSQAYAAARRGDIPTIRVGRRLLVPTALLAHKFGLLSIATYAQLIADSETSADLDPSGLGERRDRTPRGPEEPPLVMPAQAAVRQEGATSSSAARRQRLRIGERS